MKRQGFIFSIVTEDSSHLFYSTALTLDKAYQELEEDGDDRQDVVQVVEIHASEPVQLHICNTHLNK